MGLEGDALAQVGKRLPGVGCVDLARQAMTIEDRLTDVTRRDSVTNHIDRFDAGPLEGAGVGDQLAMEGVLRLLLRDEDDAGALHRPWLTKGIESVCRRLVDRRQDDITVGSDPLGVQVVAEHVAFKGVI